MRALRPAEKPAWDAGIHYGQVILDGELPPAPKGCGSTREPWWIWPQVEARLGYGVGQRVARFLVVPTFAKSWTPPSWWAVEGVQEGAVTHDFDTGETGDWHWQDLRPRADGSYRLRKGWALKITARIDGVTPGLDEGAAYALEVVRR